MVTSSIEELGDIVFTAGDLVRYMTGSQMNTYLMQHAHEDDMSTEQKERAEMLEQNVLNSPEYCSLLGIPYHGRDDYDRKKVKVFSRALALVSPDIILPEMKFVED